MPEPRPIPTLRTGVPQFDVVLRGGLPRHRLHLVEGTPGAGKTTFALRFLLEGAAEGERCLYVTLSETAEELTASATAHGWSLEGIDLFELVPAEEPFPAFLLVEAEGGTITAYLDQDGTVTNLEAGVPCGE